MDPRPTLAVCLATSAIAACALRAPPATRDAPDAAAPSPPRLVVRSWNGAEWPEPSAPRWPVLTLQPAEGLLVSVVEGDLEAAESAALARGVVPASVPARALATTQRVVGAEGSAWLEVQLEAPLDARAFAVIAAKPSPGKARAWTWSRARSEASHAGAWVADTWPADGANGVPTNLDAVCVRLSGEASGVAEFVEVRDAAGPIASVASPSDCARCGSDEGVCVVARPLAPLAPLERYQVGLRSGAADATGAPLTGTYAVFTTAAGPSNAHVSLASTECALDELDFGSACATAYDHGLALRATASEPCVVSARTGRGAPLVRAAARGEIEAWFDWPSAASAWTLELTLISYAGIPSTTTVVLPERPRDLATVAVTEVRANPHGREPDQEYVELYNFGDEPVHLGGFTLVDDPHAIGVPFDGDATLPPRGRILLVPSRFDPRAAVDDAPAPGAILLRMGTSLARGGLSNGGEPLLLRDPRGRRVSSVPAIPFDVEGRCLVRRAGEWRRGERAHFTWDDLGGCTPGRDDRAQGPPP